MNDLHKRPFHESKRTVAMTLPVLISPPKVSLVFRIGVVGHRPNRLKHADHDLLAARLRELIAAVQQEVTDNYTAHRTLYSDAAPVIRAISPLAEGVDRMFAEQAIATGCELGVILPFPQAEFERDFQPPDALEPDSPVRFRRLLSKARTVFELDGSRDDSSRAYHNAGTVVLNQSDLLVVVWDGERKNQRGGTEETFDDAIERGVPVIWVDAHAPHHWRIVTQPIRQLEEISHGQRAALTKSHVLIELQHQVRKLIELPKAAVSGQSSHYHSKSTTEATASAIKIFYAEAQARFSFAFWWKMLRDAVGDFKLNCPASKEMQYNLPDRAVSLGWPREQVLIIDED